MTIHPSAIIEAGAELDPTVTVGPYAVIEAGVKLGAGCVVGPHVHLTGLTHVGPGNRFHSGCVIGDAPQDFRYQGIPTSLTIGARNVFREHVTIHRSNRPEESTVIGDDNYFMAHCHVGHNCRLGNRVIMANGVLLGGHVILQDGAVISGNCLVHQFVRVGTLAMMQGGSAISKDLAPYTMARGDNGIAGLNTVGLRRAGISAADRLELRRLYHRLFRSPLPLREAAQQARSEFSSQAAAGLIGFILESKRGVCVERGRQVEEDAD